MHVRGDENGNRIPGRRLDYEGLVAAGIVQWPYSTFTKHRRGDPLFPRGIKDGNRVFYDADQMADYVEAYWARKEDEVQRREREEYEATLPPLEERERLAREETSRLQAEFLDAHPGILERVNLPVGLPVFPSLTSRDHGREVNVQEPDGLWIDEAGFASIMARDPQRGPVTYRVDERGVLVISGLR